MSSVIILHKIKVENANAIAGLTYGFPAITHFLGFTHALSRQLSSTSSLTLEGCAVISHQQQLHAYGNWERCFALTRNPLTREAKTAAFNEEGRMHMTVSLLIECHGMLPGEADINALKQHILKLAQRQRLAGGVIVDIARVSIHAMPTNESQTRKILRQLLPGFVLRDRSALLETHHHALQQINPQVEMIDAWLDFSAVKYHAVRDEGKETVEWQLVPKPSKGFLVPLMTGYRAVSQLYTPGEVEKTRDTTTPFCFSEAIYGIGEWCGAHRISDIDSTLWRYQYQNGEYLCRQASDIGAAEDYDELEFDY